MRFTLLSIGLFCLLSIPAIGQNYTNSADSDPAAKAILDQVREKYEAYTSIEANFSLEIQLPEQPVEIQKGTLARDGDKYRASFGSQEVLADDEALYLVLHNNKSVQINDLPAPDEDASMLSPQSLFNFYDSGEFVYTLLDTRMEAGKVVHVIEFKPTDRYSEYSKLRMLVDKNTNAMVHVKAFAKDGSRYTFYIDSIQPNKTFPASHFTYTKAQFPDYYVEDIRG